MKIGNKTIGPGHPAFVIAELGVNHDGSVHTALQLVEIAARCGADAVKLQIFRGIRLMHPSSGFAAYQSSRTNSASPIEMLRKYELNESNIRRIVMAIRDREMVPLATPFSPEDLNIIAACDLPAIKIASPDLVNKPLLFRARTLDRPLLLSTGAATLEEVGAAVGWLREWDVPFALLHCISSYPVGAKDAHLSWITELSLRYNVPVGYSDHTTEVTAGGFAVAAGASIVERHLTYDKSAHGPDHSASSDPKEFAAYVKFVRQAATLMGTPGKHVLEAEQDVRKVSRQSLVVRRQLQVGDRLTAGDLTVQRPGTGISASELDIAIGKRVTRIVPAGSILQWDMLDRAA